MPCESIQTPSTRYSFHSVLSSYIFQILYLLGFSLSTPQGCFLFTQVCTRCFASQTKLWSVTKADRKVTRESRIFFSTSKAWQNVQHNCVWHTLSLHSRNILVFLRYSESCQTLWNCTCKYDSHLCSRSWRSDPCTGVSLITSLRGKQMEFR